MLTRFPSRYLIYGLLDPRSNALRYIGKTHKRRELRLNEHIEAAHEGRTSPVYQWIRELLAVDLTPTIFVLARIPGSDAWQTAERDEISRWRNWNAGDLPYLHPPQTPKSDITVIDCVSLLNVRSGG